MSAPVDTSEGKLILDSHKLSYHMDSKRPGGG